MLRAPRTDPAGPIWAHGSHLGCMTAKRCSGQGCRMRGRGSQSLTSFAIRFQVRRARWLRRAGALPELSNADTEEHQRPTIGRHGVVGEEALNDLPQPSALLRRCWCLRFRSSPFTLLIVACRRSRRVLLCTNWKPPAPRLPADQRKSQKVKVSGLPSPAPSDWRPQSDQTDQSGLFRVNDSEKASAPLHASPPETARASASYSKSDDTIVGKAHDDHVPAGVAFPPCCAQRSNT